MAQRNTDFGEGRFGGLDPEDPDFASVEDFVEACMADGDTEFDWRHLNVLAWNCRRSNHLIRKELESFGLKGRARPNPRRIRTISSNPHDRWHGLGSSSTHGGSGWEQVQGFAGQEG